MVTASAFAGFYWGAPPLLRYFNISESAQGVALLAFLCICIACTLGGLLVGLILYPLVLRPLVSPREYWAWVGNEHAVTIPGIGLVLERWSVFLYGSRVDKK